MSEQEYAKIISKNLRSIAYEAGKTQADMAKDLKISKATISSWMNGTRIPRMDKIDLLCHYFNVSRVDIMEPAGASDPKDLVLSPEERSLVLAYRAASDERKKLALLALGIEEKKDETASA